MIHWVLMCLACFLGMFPSNVSIASVGTILYICKNDQSVYLLFYGMPSFGGQHTTPIGRFFADAGYSRHVRQLFKSYNARRAWGNRFYWRLPVAWKRYFWAQQTRQTAKRCQRCTVSAPSYSFEHFNTRSANFFFGLFEM